MRGGLTLETLNTLLSGGPDRSEDFDHVDSWEVPPIVDQATADASLYIKSNARHSKRVPITVTEVESDCLDAEMPSTHESPSKRKPTIVRKTSGAISSILDPDDDFLAVSNDTYASRAPFPRSDQRTITIRNLSDRVTHLDIVQLIRGGRVLDIHLRADRTAAVSFVEGAADFLSHTKRKDIYLHGKRLEFSWSDRQFHMPHHVANKISNGATRNIVVHASTSRTPPEPLTEQSIRNDLEHIQNLHVISVVFRNGDCYISTNSVHNALFARTCMMSRAKYKGMRIGWFPDECAQPIPTVQKNRPSPARNSGGKPTAVKQAPVLSNRFDVLDVDNTDESGSESEMLAGMGSNWADGGIAV